jgi:hypothetical protein
MPPARFLQPPIPREARLRPAVPARIGPAEFSKLGAMVAVRCPQELDPLMRKAGGLWEPGSRRWLILRPPGRPLGAGAAAHHGPAGPAGGHGSGNR